MPLQEIVAEIEGKRYKIRMDVPTGAKPDAIQGAVGDWFKSTQQMRMPVLPKPKVDMQEQPETTVGAEALRNLPASLAKFTRSTPGVPTGPPTDEQGKPIINPYEGAKREFQGLKETAGRVGQFLEHPIDTTEEAFAHDPLGIVQAGAFAGKGAIASAPTVGRAAKVATKPSVMGKAGETAVAGYVTSHSPWGLLWLGRNVKDLVKAVSQEWAKTGRAAGDISAEDVAAGFGKKYENMTPAEQKTVQDVVERIKNPQPREAPKSGERMPKDWYKTEAEKAGIKGESVEETLKKDVAAKGPAKAPESPAKAPPTDRPGTSVQVPEGIPAHYGDTHMAYGEKIGFKHAPIKDKTIIEHLEKQTGHSPESFEALPLADKNAILKDIVAPNKRGRFDPWTADAEGANSIARMLKTWRLKKTE